MKRVRYTIMWRCVILQFTWGHSDHTGAPMFKEFDLWRVIFKTDITQWHQGGRTNSVNLGSIFAARFWGEGCSWRLSEDQPLSILTNGHQGFRGQSTAFRGQSTATNALVKYKALLRSNRGNEHVIQHKNLNQQSTNATCSFVYTALRNYGLNSRV